MRARHSLHPVNAQLTRALTSSGLDPACGYLHQPSDARASLSYDALELLRADIDTRMLSLIEVRRWARADFPVTAEGVVRLSPELARVVSSRALATKRDIERVCGWFVAAIGKVDREMAVDADGRVTRQQAKAEAMTGGKADAGGPDGAKAMTFAPMRKNYRRPDRAMLQAAE